MDESQELIYEESQVLWAKIRGYPWWPAYVSDVHEADSPSDYQYTVIFFGDNTKYFNILQKASSRLGPSKLRKFPEHYAECFLKAKTNKKLRQSIQKAEQRLSENHQDISYYQNIRTDLNLKRKKNGTVSQSRLSSSQKGDPQQAPDLVKHKTQQPTRNRRRLLQTKKSQQIFEQQSVHNQNSKSLRSNQKPQKSLPQIRRGRSQKLPPTANIKKSPIKSQQFKERMEEQSLEQQPIKRFSRSKDVIESPKVQRDRYNMRSNHKSKEKLEEEQNNQDKEESVEEIEERQQPIKVTSVKPKKGRKGRPPKHQKIKQKQQQQALLSEQQQPQRQSIAQQLPKTRKRNMTQPHQKPLPSSSIPPCTPSCSSLPQLQPLLACLPNRKQITKQLFLTQITPTNIKQILDLGISAALQNGPITKNIHLLLLLLKATLLYKYFPDNNKYRKKYQKLSKEKKKIYTREGEAVGEEDGENGDQGTAGVQEDIGSFQELDIKNMGEQQNRISLMEQQQQQVQKLKKQSKQSSNKQNKQVNKQQTARPGSNSQKLNQIRKKATQKLQKMIRKTGLQQKVKEYAYRIQNTFQNTADLQGELYRNVAYRRMRNLKTKLLEFCDKEISAQEVVGYLEQVIGVYETQGHSTAKE